MSNIKLKPIEPGMVIHCPTEENAKELLKHLDELGYCWNNREELHAKTYYEMYKEDTCYEIDEEEMSIMYCYKESFIEDGKQIVEFSDLVEPGMSAEEVLSILGEMVNFYCANGKCGECPLSYENSTSARHYLCGIKSFPENKQKIIEICQKWKEQHEKKEPEIETVSICRIIEVLPDGRKRCVHEEDIKSDQVPCGSERIAVEEILKRYCMEHDGEFRAVHETISRVKKGKE